MPRRVYTITEVDREARRERARKMGKAPKTQKQCENAKKATAVACKLPRTQKQLATYCENGRKVGKLPRTKKQLETVRENIKGIYVFANTIVEHHNDLCHGTERPDDVTYMTSSEHISLHNNLRVQNGTHPFLASNRVF